MTFEPSIIIHEPHTLLFAYQGCHSLLEVIKNNQPTNSSGEATLLQVTHFNQPTNQPGAARPCGYAVSTNQPDVLDPAGMPKKLRFNQPVSNQPFFHPEVSLLLYMRNPLRTGRILKDVYTPQALLWPNNRLLWPNNRLLGHYNRLLGPCNRLFGHNNRV